MSYITTKDGVELFYKDCGEGQPIVLVHGWSISSDSWEYLVTRLTDEGYRCIAYDQRGCGRSGFSWNGYDYQTLSSDLATIIDSLQLNNVTLIGHSLGCGVVCTYLSQYGDKKIKGAVLLGTTTPFISQTFDNPDGVNETIKNNSILAMRTDRPAYIRSLADGFYDLSNPQTSVSNEMIEWTINLCLPANARAAEMMFRTSVESDFRNTLPTIQTPVLILHGDKDVSCPVAITAEPTHHLLPNSTLTVYEGLPHGFYINKTDILFGDILNFIRKKKRKSQFLLAKDL